MSKLIKLNNFYIGTNADSIESVAAEVNALKFALGLLALRLPDAEKNKFLIELTQLDDPSLQKLASEIKQFFPQ
ncbi:TPA: hypothetical protein H2A59_002413 [Salmonella enterica]|nr:hypothetical protein [Salmonella enterica]